ncbi:MAG: hypothetical protein HZB47_00950 [Nitrosomonadales bacterium]|nr:hypothetical protein [Nitrosomonadales bacterium]
MTGKIKNIGAEAVVIGTSIGDVTVESAKISRVDRETGVSSPAPGNAVRAEDAPRKSYSDWHIQQKHGLGFGPGLGSMPGIILFYDHNLSGTSQLHTQLDVNAMTRVNVWDEKIIKTQRTMLLATYRHFFSEHAGFYIGAGGGLADSKFEYNGSSLSGSPNYRYSSTLSGTFLLAEAGWQGKEGYYFHVGLQPAAYVSSSDDYDVSKVPDVSNHRAVANEEHDNLKQLGQISLGFGWFF